MLFKHFKASVVAFVWISGKGVVQQRKGLTIFVPFTLKYAFNLAGSLQTNEGGGNGKVLQSI